MKALKNYLKSRQDTILAVLGKPGRDFTAETFHELRVEIKKLNALVDLIRFYLPDFKRKKTLKPFKRIFHQAGKVRELQLEEALFDAHFRDASGDYRKHLKKCRTKEEKIFFSTITKRLVRRLKKKHRVLVAALSGINKEALELYLEEKKELMKEGLRQTPLQAEQVHTLRKQLKVLHYNRMILATKQEKLLLKKDPLSPLMGEWHDCQVMDEHLQEAMDSGRFEEEELKRLEEMKEKIATDRQRLFGQLESAVQASEFFEGQ